MRAANLNRSRPICDVIIPRPLGGTDEMGYTRQCEGRPRGLSLAHPHVHRSRCGIPIRAGRRGGERGAQDRRDSVRCCGRRARSPRRGMFVRRDRQEIQCQGCGYQPRGVDRAGAISHRSHPASRRSRKDSSGSPPRRVTTITKQFAASGISTMRFISIAGATPTSCGGIERALVLTDRNRMCVWLFAPARKY